MELIGDAPIVAMVNLDMVGVPVAVNALGDDSLVPVLERWHAASLGARRLPKGVESINWVGSDHTPYQLAGVRALTLNGPTIAGTPANLSTTSSSTLVFGGSARILSTMSLVLCVEIGTPVSVQCALPMCA